MLSPGPRSSRLRSAQSGWDRNHTSTRSSRPRPSWRGAAGQGVMEGLGTTAADYAYAVFHQPNTKFPMRVAKQLGFKNEQVEPGLLVPLIGNTYAGSAMIGLTAILD